MAGTFAATGGKSRYMEKKGLGVRRRWFPMHCGGFHAPDTPPGDSRGGGGRRGDKAMGQGPRWSLAGGRPPAVLDHGARYNKKKKELVSGEIFIQ